MKNEESKIQQSIIQTFRMVYPQYSNRLFSVPNGGKRGVVTATILKAEGAMRGVPDLVFTKPVKKYAGMFIEVKTPKGRLTPEQVAFIQEHRETHYCCVVRSVEQFLNEIKNYLKQ